MGVVVGTVGAITWWLTGDQSEAGGADPILHLSQRGDVSLAIGVVGFVVAMLMAPRVWNAVRAANNARAAMKASVAAAALGVFLGWSLRVLSALTNGANIGGGMIELASPFMVIGGLVYIGRQRNLSARNDGGETQAPAVDGD